MDERGRGRYVPLDDTVIPCSYIPGRQFNSENFMLFHSSNHEIDTLLERGFRHFGPYFFRPRCRNCHRCIPLRVIPDAFSPGRSFKRIIASHRHVSWEFHPPLPTDESFQLYRKHKQKFRDGFEESFHGYVRSFFSPESHNIQLSMYIRGALAAVSHLDITERSASAVYTYYDTDLEKVSLGSFAVITLIEYARVKGIGQVYLGYYVRECRHMNYKIRFRPNQALTGEGNWVDFFDRQGTLVNPGAMRHGFKAKKKFTLPV